MNRLHLSISLMIISASLVGNSVSRSWGSPIHPEISARMAHSAVSDQKTLPPLMDRELFLADPEIIGAQLSPDGNFMAFQKQLNGVMNVWVKGIDEPFSAAYPVTSDTESPIFFYFWSADGRYILYIQDKGGNENFHLHGAELGTALGETPVTRNLTPVDNATVQLYGIPQQTPNEIVIGLNDRDPKFYDVYRLNLTTGERSLIIQNDETIADWTVDQGGTVRLAHRQSLAGGNELLKVENGNFQPIYRCALEETCAPVQFHPNGQQIYLKTNRDTDLTQLELLDLETGQSRSWGKGVMQHDVTDGVQYLIDQGIADPERIGITGFSYGGYATLAGLAFTPELYAAGASLSGPSNLITLMQEIPPYWVPIRDSLSLRVGNPDDPRDRNRLMTQSPLFAADQIQAPLLVVQGANDPRVPKAESDQIVAALRERNRPVEYLVALDEGHGFRQEDNIFATTAALERFFADHLGGRYQAELSPELQAQLEILTVDIEIVQ
ncbi:prolyl oligopeptidase family serine peptidase [Leptothoe sp. ISB3NOV94-8A]